MDRYDIIKIIPKPSNQDVIVYDFSLKNLLDINVIENYNKDLAAYKIKKDNYILLDAEIKQYEDSLNKIYLYMKNWSEMDYIERLKEEKKYYSKIYSTIKKIENNIDILEKKYKSINEQIEIQKNKDKKEIENKKKNIDSEIENTKNKISKIKERISEYDLQYKRIEEHISDIKEEINLLEQMQENITTNHEYKCQYCGTIITHEGSKRRIYNLLQKSIDKNIKKISVLQNDFNKAEQSLAYYENELSSLKSILKNNIEFKKQDYNFYIKKSIKVLELEAIRDEILKNIVELKEQYHKNSDTSKKDFIETKDRISKYELSLENLKKIKENKENFKEKYQQLNKLKNELIELHNNLKEYKKFLEIYYKIYEQKINDYFGKDIKFKLFKFEGIELKEIFQVFYKDIEYTELPKKMKEDFDNIYIEKISYLY